MVEDSPDDAELILHQLRELGRPLNSQRVDSAAQLAAALADRWDIVLCDFAMPSFDALAALAIFKGRRMDVPFIIISGTMEEDTAVRAMKAGAHDFFRKDSLTRLPAAIERELREAEMRRERSKLREQLLLSDRLISIGTLAAGVAHEINNPLAYVLGNVEFAIERLSGAANDQGLLPEDCADLLRALYQVREGSERIRVTTRDLRVFCRTEEAAPAAVDVQRVLDSAISMAWNEIRHRARIVRDFEPVASVDGNESRLGQVFLNLLINAAQAIEDGDPNRDEICVRTRAADGGLTVEIVDSGRGMSPEVLAQLFQPFFTTKPIGVGTGLGLSICRGIVEELGGRIEIESALGQGTTVRVRLPAGRHEPRVTLSRPPPAPAKRARVLVIDDEPALCSIVDRLLNPDHDVVVAFDAISALERIDAEGPFDAVLCDLMMPRMSGMDFHAQLIDRASVMAERVIFLTGGAFSSRAAQFLDRVPNPRLDKPFDPTALRRAIAKLVGGE